MDRRSFMSMVGAVGAALLGGSALQARERRGGRKRHRHQEPPGLELKGVEKGTSVGSASIQNVPVQSSGFVTGGCGNGQCGSARGRRR